MEIRLAWIKTVKPEADDDKFRALMEAQRSLDPPEYASARISRMRSGNRHDSRNGTLPIPGLPLPSFLTGRRISLNADDPRYGSGINIDVTVAGVYGSRSGGRPG
jgi:hypothetical protein